MGCSHTDEVANSLKAPTSADSVYKDDCMFCFDTAFDTDGLDICLHCYQSFSRGQLDHTHKHSDIFDHFLFLNYKKVAKPKSERDEQPLKMAKLEIREETESELFDVKTSLYCSQCDQEIDEIPPNVSVVMQAVLKATSSEKKDEIKSWEQEIVPCQHAFDIAQHPLAGVDLTHCTQCDLKENLWICITCGALGCGRAQFGGVPGNSHALAHYQNCESHPIAVKLGSLSTTSADCFCYACNDEVKIPELPQLLSTFGINIDSYVKTEKNLTELQIEQNVKWDFNMDRQDGASLEPLFGPGFTGLKNMGNSCYLSSVLQVLFSTPAYQTAFATSQGVPDECLINQNPAHDLETQLYKVSDGLLSGRYSVPDESTSETIKYQKGIKPSGLKSLIGEGHPEFCTMKQQDAFEFWLYLTDKVDRLFKDQKSPNVPFKFVIENKLKCTKCGGVRLSKELSEVVSLAADSKYNIVNDEKVYEPISFDDVMKNFGDSEQIEYRCPQCQSNELATKSSGFLTYPDILILNPQRIKLENWVPTKTQVPIVYSNPLDLSPYKAPGMLPGETELPETDESEDGKFIPNETAMDQLVSMGFSENRATKALFNTDNSDADSAMNWLFQHIEDADIDDPFVEVPRKSSSAKKEDVDSLIAMGFSKQLAEKALLVSAGNLEAAVEWVFANPDDDGSIEEEETKKPNDLITELTSTATTATPKYHLKAVICHKGTNVNSGHYVAFIRRIVNNVEQWVLFNDEKVVLSDGDSSLEDLEKRGYIYVFEKEKSMY
ncbi:unnamed protein product [Kuraishia capsulata CBS 1993]|uniref:Ubiquitin carboxyl-terminal hydrolase n=1 Tax=Kuraishia capsulata CBS 1993 TaxID=1382522 RepID=W6MHJ5_9ASCO|nr:uncharacterized protein KUCA_T00001150001 [Kuraishia capsulata CBS 1993]CDK25183.1 unnamed protein product [Kuraishia capsulata CBS 1993]